MQALQSIREDGLPLPAAGSSASAAATAEDITGSQKASGWQLQVHLSSIGALQRMLND
jgi:hypothetical protein